jgi:hypothetical protein
MDLAGAAPALEGRGELLRSGSLRARFQDVLHGLRRTTGAPAPRSGSTCPPTDCTST